MSDYSAKIRGSETVYEQTRLTEIDLTVAANQSVGVHTIDNVYAPRNHYVVASSFYAEEAIDSATDAATLSVGFDSDSEPDNLLNDEFGNLDVDDDLVEGLAKEGALVKVGDADAQMYYEIKSEVASAGKIIMSTTYRPYARVV